MGGGYLLYFFGLRFFLEGLNFFGMRYFQGGGGRLKFSVWVEKCQWEGVEICLGAVKIFSRGLKNFRWRLRNFRGGGGLRYFDNDNE